MGLHAQIHQTEDEVSIALRGEFRDSEYDQLSAIVTHFRSRGCQSFVLDLSGLAKVNASTATSLRRLVGILPSGGTDHAQNISAIRLMADNPAVRPQTDCGDFLLAS